MQEHLVGVRWLHLLVLVGFAVLIDYTNSEMVLAWEE
jgi:hypothetical protein